MPTMCLESPWTARTVLQLSKSSHGSVDHGSKLPPSDLALRQEDDIKQAFRKMSLQSLGASNDALHSGFQIPDRLH